MAQLIPGLFVWLALLVIAIPYVGHIRHPASRPLGAYLIFVTTFSLVAGGAFWLLVRVALATGQGWFLGEPLAMALALSVILIAAFGLARWMVRRPPIRPPPI